MPNASLSWLNSFFPLEQAKLPALGDDANKNNLGSSTAPASDIGGNANQFDLDSAADITLGLKFGEKPDQNEYESTEAPNFENDVSNNVYGSEASIKNENNANINEYESTAVLESNSNFETDDDERNYDAVVAINS